MLSQLLVALKPLAQDDMHLISDKEIARSTVNDRLQSIYKAAGLDERVYKLASSTNESRNRSAADDPGRPSIKDQERQSKRACYRIQTKETALTMYAQDKLGTV